MPKPVITREVMNALTEEQKNALLKQNANKVFNQKYPLYEKTIKAQTNDLEKIYAFCLFAANANLLTPISHLEPIKQYELGYNPDGIPEKMTELQDEFEENIVSGMISAPKPAQNQYGLKLDMEEIKNFYENLGLIQAKAAHDLAKERDAVYASLGDQYDEQTKNDLADYLTSYSGSLSSRMIFGTQALQTTIASKKVAEDNQTTYDDLMRYQLTQQFKTMLGDQNPPTMTVGEFMDAVNMRDNLRSTWLKQMKCKQEDNFYQVLQAEADQKTQGRKLSSLEGAAKTKRINDLHNQVIRTMTENYVREMPRGWFNNAAQRYEAALQPSERKLFREGHRLANPDEYDFKDVKRRLQEKAPDYEMQAIKLHDKTAEKCFRDAEEKLVSGQSMKIRQAYGVSESITIPDAAKRSFLMSGIIRSLESTGTTWSGHKKNSKTYEKMLSSMRDYKKALETGEGGKARDLRKSVLNNCLAYVKDKGRVRRETNGQKRFDDAMTVLAMELPPEKFQLVCDELNKKRGDDEKIGINDYDQYAKLCMDKEKQVESDVQLRAYNVVTESGRNNAQAISKLTSKYGPGLDSVKLPAVGRKDVMPGYVNLSDLDFTALSLGSSLSAPGGNHMAGQPLQELTAEAVKEGKKVTNAAMNAYGNGNKEPLARLITQCLENMKTAAAENRPPEEQACLDEMSTRLREMAARDPELQKIARRNGMEAAPAANQPDAPAREMNQPEVGLQPQI